MARRAVFLDRDGVLNRTFRGADGVLRPPQTVDEIEILDGVTESCRLLRQAGYLLVAVTNQPEVTRGTQRKEVVDAINSCIRECLNLDGVLVCLHDDEDRCKCRKPEPGMLIEAATCFDIDVRASFIVGDRDRDIEAGRRAGCRGTVLIADAHVEGVAADLRVPRLRDAVDWLVAGGPAAGLEVI